MEYKSADLYSGPFCCRVCMQHKYQQTVCSFTVNLKQIRQFLMSHFSSAKNFSFCSPDIDRQCFPQSHIHPCHCCLEMQEVVISKKERQLCKNTQRDGVSKKEATRRANLQKRHRELVGCERELVFFWKCLDFTATAV